MEYESPRTPLDYLELDRDEKDSELDYNLESNEDEESFIDRFRRKQKGKLMLEHNKYSLLLAPTFSRWARRTGEDTLDVYQDSGVFEAMTSFNGVATAVLGGAFLATLDSYRRSLDLKENYQKGVLENMVEEEFGRQLREEELDELYSRVVGEN